MKTPLIERCIAAVAVLVLSPLMLVVAVGVRLASHGPAWHRARRIGRDGVPFELLKFRSMVVDPDGPRGARVTLAGDPRINRLGRLLRATKVDELPQLVNVLRGDMRFVGPRPEDPAYVDLEDPEQRELLRVPPGITSPASIEYRHEESVLADLVASGRTAHDAYLEVAAAKRQIDLGYIRRRSAVSDIQVILRTVRAVFDRRSGPSSGPSSGPVAQAGDQLDRDARQALDRTYQHYSGDYSQRWSSAQPGNRAISEERESVAQRLLANRSPGAALVLDVGAGSTGSFPSTFVDAQRIRFDILEWRLRELPPDAVFGPPVCGDGAALPFRSASVDAVLLSTVLSSAPESVGASMLAEIERVLRPGGVVLIYDFRVPNPRNRATHPVSRRWVRSNLPDMTLTCASLTVLPQLSRHLGSRTEQRYRLLARVPFLRSHNIMIAVRRESDPGDRTEASR